MPKTPQGLPYPAETEPMADMALAIKNLAEAMEKRVQAGTVQITPVANTVTSAAVTFPTPYAAPPVVTVTAQTAVPGSQVQEVSAFNITATGCNVYVYRTNTTSVTISWTAVGQVP